MNPELTAALTELEASIVALTLPVAQAVRLVKALNAVQIAAQHVVVDDLATKP